MSRKNLQEQTIYRRLATISPKSLGENPSKADEIRYREEVAKTLSEIATQNLIPISMAYSTIRVDRELTLRGEDKITGILDAMVYLA